MSYQLLGRTIKNVIEHMDNHGLSYTLIGGLAVSFRTIERTTKDIDFLFAVDSDKEAESVIRSFKKLGFSPITLLENKNLKIISTVRLLSKNYPGIYLDLLFRATGIESEIVASSDLIELLPKLKIKVASLPSLIAMKILSSNNQNRRQDLIDLQNLILEASGVELKEAKRLVSLMQERGFNGGMDLNKKYQNLCQEILKTNN